MQSDEDYMQLALAEASAAAQTGDVPVGAIVVDSGGNVISCGRNRREVDRDPTAHAEVVAIRRAAAHVSTWRLHGCSLFVTLEPCPMCAGALVNARIERVVYGCDDPKAGALRSLYALGADLRLNHRFEVTAGVLAADSARLLREFFARLRQNP